ncbi:lytic transglycosylase domain-containing protein [Actinosynnema sp. ALI-1.44]|uniref:lytic transglycosylase domain-containing protein n=1 Tax=Actinosynnema sp. ALI-1.44 TaxID=1933779 RepID=UPI00117847D9|nr:lytic murein transglycosylase [Actinosynnema sp. ALI-1.44]
MTSHPLVDELRAHRNTDTIRCMPFPRGPKWTIPAAVVTASAVLVAMTSGPVGRYDQNQRLAGSFVVPPSVPDVPNSQAPAAQFREDKKADDIDKPAPEPVVPVVFAGAVPSRVLDAYEAARDRIDQAQPGCHLPLELLEAIGKVETNHARNGQVDKNGTTLAPILGPALDGVGFARIPDTDGGRLDGDTVWDRAVGPMQFIPTTWQNWSSDNNGDNTADPHNVFDAALSAARYLCADNRDLATPNGVDQAILSYNNSEGYRVVVRSWMTAYANGTSVIPDTVVPAGYVPDAPHAPTGSTSAPTTTPPPPTTPPPTGTSPVTPPPSTTPPGTPPPSGNPTTPPPSTTPPSTTPPTTTPPTGTKPAPPAPESPVEPLLDVVCDVSAVVGKVLDPLAEGDVKQPGCADPVPAGRPTSASSSRTGTASSPGRAVRSAAGS